MEVISQNMLTTQIPVNFTCRNGIITVLSEPEKDTTSFQTAVVFCYSHLQLRLFLEKNQEKIKIEIK